MVLWVFGYGSLVWNPGFEFDEKIIGFIKDYRRVFDLGREKIFICFPSISFHRGKDLTLPLLPACIDHRGTPENPARTCTLEPKAGAICWGAAYCVRGDIERERAAMEYLRRRECEYDIESHLDFYREGETSEPALTGVLIFLSTMDKEANKYYLGPAPLVEMASQIASANGPSGNNRDYLFKLEKEMANIGHEDDYVVELANEVRNVLDSHKQPKSPNVPLSLRSHAPFLPIESRQENPLIVDS